MMRWWMRAALAASVGAMLFLVGCDDDDRDRGDPDIGQQVQTVAAAQLDVQKNDIRPIF